MTVGDLKKLLKSDLKKLIDPDGFDLAFYDGIQHVIDSSGDGGLSVQYTEGLRFALSKLSTAAIESYE
jgi:hypothetical protein